MNDLRLNACAWVMATSPDHELLLEAADALEALAKEKALQACTTKTGRRE